MKDNEIRAVCPLCGRAYHGVPALSRTDNATPICPDCGIRQALESMGVKADEQEQILAAIHYTDYTNLLALPAREQKSQYPQTLVRVLAAAARRRRKWRRRFLNARIPQLRRSMTADEMKEENAMKNEITTMEHLQTKASASYGAVLKYGDKVLVTDCHWKGGFTARVYEFIETPEETGLGYVECRLNLISMSEEIFEDGGHAIAWAMRR